MPNRIVVLIACLALAVTAWAGDPWKEKTYKDWDEKDVNKILSDSPWARPVTVSAFWRSGGGSVPSLVSPIGGAETASGEEGESGAPRAASSGGESGGGGGVSEAHFTLRWVSARTIREALARSALLKGSPQAEAEKIINLPITEHQLVLFGPDMAPFAKSDEMSLMEKTFIKLKKTKQKVSPFRVEIRRSQDGKRVAGIIFFFAIKSETGEPIIAADEKGVQFECRNDLVTIRQSFDPQKMVSKAGPDLK